MAKHWYDKEVEELDATPEVRSCPDCFDGKDYESLLSQLDEAKSKFEDIAQEVADAEDVCSEADYALITVKAEEEELEQEVDRIKDLLSGY